MSGRKHNVRWREDVGFELRCEVCSYRKQACYWPLTSEFWVVNKGLSRCRSCWNEYENGRRMRKNISAIAKKNAERREYSRTWRQRRREYNRVWMQNKRERERIAEGRERYERRKAA